MPKLKPCPFCGGTDFKIDQWIECKKCGIETKAFKSMLTACDFWNKRSGNTKRRDND